MKTDTVYKRAFNQALELVSQLSHGDALPSENALSARLGVSRTTVRKVLSTLVEHGVVSGNARRRVVRSGRKSVKVKRFPEAETVPMSAQVEKRFMEWMLRDNARPGTAIHELEMARQFGVATARHPRVPEPVSALRTDREAARTRAGCSKASRRTSRSSSSRSAKCSSCGRRGSLRRCRRARRSGGRSRRSVRSTSRCWMRSRSASMTFPISTAAFTA